MLRCATEEEEEGKATCDNQWVTSPLCVLVRGRGALWELYGLPLESWGETVTPSGATVTEYRMSQEKGVSGWQTREICLQLSTFFAFLIIFSVFLYIASRFYPKDLGRLKHLLAMIEVPLGIATKLGPTVTKSQKC